MWFSFVCAGGFLLGGGCVHQVQGTHFDHLSGPGFFLEVWGLCVVGSVRVSSFIGDPSWVLAGTWDLLFLNFGLFWNIRGAEFWAMREDSALRVPGALWTSGSSEDVDCWMQMREGGEGE